jgi:hypothetical protein
MTAGSPLPSASTTDLITQEPVEMAKALWRNLSIACTAALLFSACGGGGDSIHIGGMTINVSPGGIWTGTESSTGLSVTGIVDETGEFHFIRSDGTQYVGTATTTGTAISATFDGYTPFETTFADGSTHGTGTLSGTINERASISISTQFRTDKGTISSDSLSLTFDSLYNFASSLATISGTYTDPKSGDVISVTGAGDVTWQDASTGCVGNGTISIINGNYNAYRVAFTYGNCTGGAAALNGVQFSGLVTLDNKLNPVQAIIGVTGQANGTTYALVLTLNRS